MRRGHRVAVVATAVLAVALAVIGLLFGASDGVDEFGLVAWVIAASILGAYIEIRTSGNRMARILLATGVVGSFAAISDVLMPSADAAVMTIADAIWAGVGAISFFSFLWSTFGLLPLVFPTGHPMSRFWSWVMRIGLGALIVATPVALFTPQYCAISGENGCDRWLDSPIGVSWMPHPEYGWFGTVFFTIFLVTIGLGLVSIIIRFFRSRGIERQQIKWLLVILTLSFLWTLVDDIILVLVLGLPETTGLFVNIMEGLSWASIPIAITLAVLRYRLYEIDRIISRTVTYTLVVGLLVAVVSGIAALAGAQFEEPWVVAATTLGVAALFSPLRRRVQTLVDRRFNRSRYDAERVMDEFVGSLRDRIDPDSVVNGWIGVVDETMQPASLGVWVRS